MARIQGEVLIRRPVEEVFDFVADERNEPTYNPNMLAADIDFCMSECINRPDTPRAIVFDTVANTYKMIDTTTNATITDPGDGLPFLNDFATGRTTQVAGVTITSVTMNGLPFTTLTFDSYGRPLITADMLITLSYAGKTMTVTVKQTTGDVTIQ